VVHLAETGTGRHLMHYGNCDKLNEMTPLYNISFEAVCNSVWIFVMYVV